MLSLAQLGGLVGSFMLLLGLAGLAAPGPTRRALSAFPRHRGAAVALTLFNTVWVANMVYHAPLGRFEWIKPLLIVLAPLTFFAVIRYMDELLAPRMWGGFLLLMGAPALDIARWHDSAWRLALTLLVYAWIVWGMLLVLSPYRFRHAAEWVFEGGRRWPVFAASLLIGAGLLFLSATVY